MHIEVNNYSKKIKGKLILDNINIKLEGGKIYGFRGTNGSGKTMLMRAISGLILPTNGEVLIDGQVIGKQVSFPESMGIMLEYPSFIGGYSGFRNLKMIASIKKLISDDEIKESIKAVGLDPEDSRAFRKYSLGMKQRLGIACAIMEKPELLLLDEPFNALDTAGIEQIKDILRKQRDEGKLIIIACHSKEDMDELADEIFEIYEGQVTNHIIAEG